MDKRMQFFDQRIEHETKKYIVSPLRREQGGLLEGRPLIQRTLTRTPWRKHETIKKQKRREEHLTEPHPAPKTISTNTNTKHQARLSYTNGNGQGNRLQMHNYPLHESGMEKFEKTFQTQMI